MLFFTQGSTQESINNVQVSPEVEQWFAAVDRDRSGKISAVELKAALANGQGGTFSDTACKLMIGNTNLMKKKIFPQQFTLCIYFSRNV